jgi:RNA polymerase sigma factor (sigma-70 family)
VPDKALLFASGLALADKIAAAYGSTPGVEASDLRAVARAALHRASEGYNPNKGAFEAYAGRAIRNALNSLHQEQVRLARRQVLEADLCPPLGDTEGAATAPMQKLPDQFQDVLNQVRSAESKRVLANLLAKMPDRTRKILAMVGAGHSYTEIAERHGISKQAAHKTAAAAMNHLRERLTAQGFQGLDSQGLLRASDL